MDFYLQKQRHKTILEEYNTVLPANNFLAADKTSFNKLLCVFLPHEMR